MDLRTRRVGIVAVLAAAWALAGCGGTSVSVGVSSLDPVADAGPSQVRRVGELVTLDGSASRDPEGGAITFKWTQVEGPVALGLSDPASKKPTFTPGSPGTYTITLVVTKSGSPDPGPESQTTVVVVDDNAAAPRRPPAAEPRAAGLRVLVTYTPPAGGFLSSTDGVTASGKKIPVAFIDVVSSPADDPTAAQVNGMLKVDVESAGAIVAHLYFPVAAGDDECAAIDFGGTLVPAVQYGVVGTPFVLDGSRSTDDGVVRTFTWTQVEGPFRFTTEDGTVSVVPTSAGLYVFDLVATDNIGLTSFPQRLVIPVLPAGSPAVGPPDAHVLPGPGTGAGDGVVLTAEVGGSFSLDASSSRSRNGGSLTFAWEQVSGPPAQLSSFLGSSVLSVVPQVPGAYLFQLHVLDATGGRTRVRTWVSVVERGRPPPLAVVSPVPDAMLPLPGMPPLDVHLDATASLGHAPLVYAFTQVRGAPYAVDAVAPGLATVRIDQPGAYEFEVRVFDGVAWSPPSSVSFRVE